MPSAAAIKTAHSMLRVSPDPAGDSRAHLVELRVHNEHVAFRESFDGRPRAELRAELIAIAIAEAIDEHIDALVCLRPPAAPESFAFVDGD